MPTIPKTTANITDSNWITIQQRISAGNAFDDTAPLDDVGGGGAGPFLVFENGMWKYPEQAVGGRFELPRAAKPYYLVSVVLSLGASVAWSVNLKGNPDNTTDTPYASGDAALYREGDVLVDSGTDQVLSKNYSVYVAPTVALIHPGQYVWFETPAVAGGGVVRMTFQPLYDFKG